MKSSFTSTRIPRGPNIRWIDEDTQHLIQWLGVRNDKSDPTNLNLYIKGKKVDACRRMLMDTGLDVQRPDISKGKARDKIAQMIKAFKDTRSLTDQTG